MTTTSRIEALLKNHLAGALCAIESPKPHQQGKVRDIFDTGSTLCMVNTDRISAFDRILGTIPLKGALLCEQAEYWFSLTKNICPNHLIDRPDPQIMVCKKAQPFLVEVVVRGFLAGSLMREDKHTRGAAYGLSLDPHLLNYQQFAHPIITPTTKAAYGEHDQPISAKEIVTRNIISKTHWQTITDFALALFSTCSAHALTHGLLLVDTKYEFGLIDGRIHLIDEVHTSDSSRFFIKSDYDEKFSRNEPPLMLDKEFLRQYLIAQGATEALHGVVLDDQIRLEVAKRYVTLTEKITGREFIAPKEVASSRVMSQLKRLVC